MVTFLELGVLEGLLKLGPGLSGAGPGSWSGLYVTPLKSVSNAGVAFSLYIQSPSALHQLLVHSLSINVSRSYKDVNYNLKI